MKINLSDRPRGDEKDISKVWIFPSSSRPALRHAVILEPGKPLVCTCEGFGSHQHCWHADKVTEEFYDEPITD